MQALSGPQPATEALRQAPFCRPGARKPGGDTQHGLQVLHEHFQGSKVRTEDPEQAQLFMIPVYLGRYYNWFWQQWSTPGNPWEIVEDCEPRHRAGSPECWWEKWMWAKGVSELLISCHCC